MKRLFLSLLVVAAFSFSAFAQIDTSGLKTVELLSPFDAEGGRSEQAARKYCFSFINENSSCGKVADIYYGTRREGDDWNFFQVMGAGNRNKIKSLGKKNWTDDFKVPTVEPYAKLKDGEQRRIVLGNSGGAALPALPQTEAGSADVFPNSANDVANINSKPRRETPKSDYDPYVKAVAGNMYVMRVVDDNNDFYVLFRVDEIEKGKRVSISWKRIEAPKAS